MLLLEKITYFCFCYMLDECSILKPSVTYSSLFTPYTQYKQFGSISLTINRILFLVEKSA